MGMEGLSVPQVCVCGSGSVPTRVPTEDGGVLSNTTPFSVPCPDGFSLSTQEQEHLCEYHQNLTAALAGKPQPSIPTVQKDKLRPSNGNTLSKKKKKIREIKICMHAIK